MNDFTFGDAEYFFCWYIQEREARQIKVFFHVIGVLATDE
jgi:hypothetical protein